MPRRLSTSLVILCLATFAIMTVSPVVSRSANVAVAAIYEPPVIHEVHPSNDPNDYAADHPLDNSSGSYAGGTSGGSDGGGFDLKTLMLSVAALISLTSLLMWARSR